MIQNLSSQLEQARHLLTQMQDYSLLQRGLLQLVCTDDADLVQLARSVVAHQQARSPHLLFTVTADEEPLRAYYDQVLVEEVLSALLSYATTRSPREKVISVRLSVNAPHEATLVSVRYEEPESRTQEHDHLFDLQYWMKPEPDRQNLELALDLHLSAAIIRLHGGRIWSEQHETNHHLSFVLPRSPKEESSKPHESSI
jgi:K+-sensing histidine kinase KdpD